MAKTTTKPTAKTSKEIFAEIINTFKEEIEKGNNPFYINNHQINFSNGKTYTGINNPHLAHVAKLKGYKLNEWLTYKQALKLKGHVNKGEVGTPVLFFKPSIVVNYLKNGKPHSYWSNQNKIDDALTEVKSKIKGASQLKGSKTFVLKHYMVFNICQTNLRPATIEKEALTSPLNIKVAASNNLTLLDGESAFASYDVEMDVLDGAFSCTDYNLLYQAIVESTKHESRENRSLEFEEEEIVKAIGASYLAYSSGIPFDLNEKMVEMLLKKIDSNPHSLWKYARLADDAFKLIQSWVQEIGKAA